MPAWTDTQQRRSSGDSHTCMTDRAALLDDECTWSSQHFSKAILNPTGGVRCHDSTRLFACIEVNRIAGTLCKHVSMLMRPSTSRTSEHDMVRLGLQVCALYNQASIQCRSRVLNQVNHLTSQEANALDDVYHNSRHYDKYLLVRFRIYALDALRDMSNRYLAETMVGFETDKAVKRLAIFHPNCVRK